MSYTGALDVLCQELAHPRTQLVQGLVCRCFQDLEKLCKARTTVIRVHLSNIIILREGVVCRSMHATSSLCKSGGPEFVSYNTHFRTQ